MTKLTLYSIGGIVVAVSSLPTARLKSADLQRMRFELLVILRQQSAL